MSDLNNFLAELAEAKKQKKLQNEDAKKNLGDFLSVVAEAKAADPKHQMLKEVKKHIQEDIASLFGDLQQSKQVSINKINELVEAVELVEEIEAEPLQEELLVEVDIPEVKPASQIHSQAEIEKYLSRNASFQQPEPEVVDPNIRAVQDKLKFLEQAVGRIAATGPGSGEVNFRWLDDVDRSSIDKDRYLSYDPTTKKFLFLDTRVSIEAFDRRPSIPLLQTPQLLKPSSFTNSKNLTYDPDTGVFTFLTQCEVTLALTVNALANASNQRVYQYAERNTGSGWVPIENSGKNFQLTNGQHTQIVNAQTISRLAGEQIRYFIYASEVGKVQLVTESLPNITGSTVYVPAIRIQYAGR